MVLSLRFLGLAFLVSSAWLIGAAPGRADFMGTLYFTTFAGGSNVNKIDYDYKPGVSFSFTSPIKGIASTPGADGVVFTSDGYLAVGGQGGAVYKVNPTTGAFTSVGTGGTSAYEMMAAPDGKIYSSGAEAGLPTPAVYPSDLSKPGTAKPVTGDNTGVTHITWSDATHAFYTLASGGSGFGDFGTIDPSTFVTKKIFSALPAAHGMTFDPYTGDLILFGDSHVTQIDPSKPGVIVSDLTLSLGSTFDQGAVDGLGHIFIANNGGDLAFIDISKSGLVGSPDFVATPFLAGALDDIAPLVGAGSAATPEPASLAVMTFGGLALLGYRWRRGKMQ
jgi:hypothetical protein